MQEAKKRYDEIQDHYRRTVAKNKALKGEVAGLKGQLSQQEEEGKSRLAALQQQVRTLLGRCSRLEEEVEARDQAIKDLQARLPSPGRPTYSEGRVQALEDELRKSKSSAAMARKELALSRVQIEEALALGKKRDEQIRMLLKRIKVSEGEVALWKEELKTKVARISTLEKRLLDCKSPSVEAKKNEPMERKLQKVMKELEDKKGEIELLKEMMKKSSPMKGEKPQQQELTMSRVHRLHPSQSPGYGYLPKVKASLTPVPYLQPKPPYSDLWPRDSQRRQNIKSFLSPAKPVRPMVPEATYYSSPLDLIHKNIMNYTPSELRLPPVEVEESRGGGMAQQSSVESIGSRSIGRENDSELSPEDL